MNRSLILPTLVAGLIGLAGLLLVLFAWHLPPFQPANPSTENAYLRGEITTLSPQLSGYIREVRVHDFQSVEAGDVIAVIDERIFREKLAQARASLAGAEASMQIALQNVRSAEAVERADQALLAAAELSVTTAQSDSSRTTTLRERGVVTETANEQSELALQRALSARSQAQATLDVQRETVKNAQAQIGSAQAQIDSAKAQVELAGIDLENTVIRAPAAGQLGQVSVRVGQYVTAGSGLVSHVGQKLWLIANFTENMLGRIEIGQKAEFTVDALPGAKFTGHVQSFSPAAASEYSLLSGTNATGNFTKIPQRVPVRIEIDPGQKMAERLAPGYSVVVSVEE